MTATGFHGYDTSSFPSDEGCRDVRTDVTVTGYHGYDGIRPMYCFDLCRSSVIKTFLSIISELPLTVL